MRLNSKNGTSHLGVIKDVSKKDMPLKKDGWQFNWKELTKNKSNKFFGLYIDGEIQGILAVELAEQPDSIMFYLNLIEVASNNYGSNGEYYEVAGCLLAYACQLSANWLEKDNPYFGYVLFEAKTKLVERYQIKYGAELIGGQKMVFTPEQGAILIKEYLDN